MVLAEWMRLHEMTQQRFAGEVGVTQTTVSRWLDGGTLPSLPAILAVARVTAGAVTADDFYKPDANQ